MTTLDRLHQMFDWDCRKVLLAVGTNLGAQLSDLDLLLKIAVSLVTLAYVLLKVRALLRRGRDREE